MKEFFPDSIVLIIVTFWPMFELASIILRPAYFIHPYDREEFDK
jgi:hypothetical protein